MASLTGEPGSIGPKDNGAGSDDADQASLTRSGASEACYRRGRAASRGEDRRKSFQAGMSVAKARVAANENDPEGLFWLAVNTGAEALERGRMQALPALPEMERLLLRCHAAMPTYEHAGAARVLGRLYHKAPALISIGSNKKAAEWLDRAVALAPEHPGNLAFAADFLAHHGNAARATEMARKSLTLLSGGDFAADGIEWKAVADQVLTDVPKARR